MGGVPYLDLTALWRSWFYNLQMCCTLNLMDFFCNQGHFCIFLYPKIIVHLMPLMVTGRRMLALQPDYTVCSCIFLCPVSDRAKEYC